MKISVIDNNLSLAHPMNINSFLPTIGDHVFTCLKIQERIQGRTVTAFYNVFKNKNNDGVLVLEKVVKGELIQRIEIILSEFLKSKEVSYKGRLIVEIAETKYKIWDTQKKIKKLRAETEKLTAETKAIRSEREDFFSNIIPFNIKSIKFIVLFCFLGYFTSIVISVKLQRWNRFLFDN